MNMWMKWQTPQPASKGGEKKGEKKSLWICSSCTSMRLNSANNQQERKKGSWWSGIWKRKDGATLSLVSEKRVPLPVLFLQTISTLSFHYTIELKFENLQKSHSFFPFVFPRKLLPWSKQPSPVSRMSIKCGMKMAKREGKRVRRKTTWP